MSSEKDTLRGGFPSDDDTANDSSADVNVSVLLGNGDGSFQAAVSFAAGDGPASVADLEGDSVPDPVVANRFSHDVSVTARHCARWAGGDAYRSPLEVGEDEEPGRGRGRAARSRTPTGPVAECNYLG